MGHTSRSRRRWLGGAVVAAGVVSAALVPFATGGPGPSPSPIPEGCRLHSPQPEAPLKLNLVAVRGLAKAIAMEKEVFDCFDARSTLAQIKDHETFIEIVQRAKGGKKPTVKTIAVTVMSVTCVKDLKTGRVSCKSARVPLARTSTPLSRCRPTRSRYPFEPMEQPSHPVEMSTVLLHGKLAKTVKVEKEVFDCAGQIGDLYVFTELVEAVRGSKGFAHVSTKFQGVMCFKNEARATLVSCSLFTPARAS